MKTIIRMSLIVVLACSVAIAAHAAKKTATAPAAPAAPAAAAPQPSVVADFKNSGDWKKLDAELQTTWEQAMTSDPTTRLDCFVRVESPADLGDQSFLFSKGFNVRQFSGPIATGHMAAKDLPDVAKLPFVQSIKLSH